MLFWVAIAGASASHRGCGRMARQRGRASRIRTHRRVRVPERRKGCPAHRTHDPAVTRLAHTGGRGRNGKGVAGVNFLSVWSDGAYLITRTPKPGLLRARRTGNAVACFGANPTEAWAKHQAAIADF